MISLLAAERHSIRPIDVVTDGLSNDGNPVEPARRLQREFGAYIHIYLIDPIDEALHIAHEIVGREGEGDVDPIASADALRDRGRESVDSEHETYGRMDQVFSQHMADRREFSHRAAQLERPLLTTAHPEAIAPGEWTPVDVYVYLKEFRELVEKEVRTVQNREKPRLFRQHR